MGNIRKRIGIIGGGQLGKMLVESALPWNVSCNILENDAECPAAVSATELIVGKLTDDKPLRELASISDILTYEIEHVGVETLLELEKEGKVIVPSPRILQIIQDKGLQKEFYRDNGIPSPEFVLVDKPSEWDAAVKSLGGEKYVAKSRRGGYDGKGVSICRAGDAPAFEESSVIEQFIPCEKEIAIIVARGLDGELKSFPPVEMVFDPEANLVDTLLCPAQLDPIVAKKAREIANLAVEKLNGFGLFAVEMFVTADGSVMVNEIAPRPHNSGHHTIEACLTSQYEQLIRILTGVPLGDTHLIKPAAMINILGSKEFKGEYKVGGMDEALKTPGVFMHLYRKRLSAPMRKLGHITIMADTVEEVLNTTKRIKDLVKIIPA